MLNGDPAVQKKTYSYEEGQIADLLKHRGYTIFRMSDEQVRGAVALLIKCEEQTRKAAARAFGKMGSRATKVVAGELSHVEPEVRAVAAELIGYMGTAGAQHVDLVAKLLRDDAGIVRRSAVAALGGLGQPGRAKAPDVARLLKDPETDVRRMAVEALRRMDASGREHVQAVVGLLKDPEWTVRRSAVEAVGSMDRAALPYSEDIAGLLKDKEWLVRGAAAEALGRLGEDAVVHCEAIQPLLVDKEWFVRNVAAEALYSLGPKGQTFLEIHHEGMRSSAAEMLATRFNPPQSHVVVDDPSKTEEKEKMKSAPEKRWGRTVTARNATKAVYAHQLSSDGHDMAQAVAQHKKTLTQRQPGGFYTGFDNI